QQVRSCIAAQVDHREALCVARNDDAALAGFNGFEPAATIASEEQADASIETTGLRLRAVEILRDREIHASVAIEVLQCDPVNRRDLRLGGKLAEFELAAEVDEHPARQLIC